VATGKFTDDDVKKFQEHIDLMFKWRNLYQFSQQGYWEKFNHVFSTVYFRKSNHGGTQHAGTTKSKLIGIRQWLQ
jgi:hypothetical protein